MLSSKTCNHQHPRESRADETFRRGTLARTHRYSSKHSVIQSESVGTQFTSVCKGSGTKNKRCNKVILHSKESSRTTFGCDCRSGAKTAWQEFKGAYGQTTAKILYFLKTGFVASKKILHLQMSEIYSIVRGKSGKSVEFGLKWGINQISRFAIGFLMASGNASDKKFCIKSIQEHIEMFGVQHVGIAPTGKAKWSVSERKAEEIRREQNTTRTTKHEFNHMLMCNTFHLTIIDEGKGIPMKELR